jgi:uncharacterized protein YjbI with pentapeptide repeats
MANQEHVMILKEGVAPWNQWRQEHRDTEPDLSGADLSGANLTTPFHFEPEDATDTEFSDSHFTGATLGTSLDFVPEDFRDINLSGADLSDADLSNANLVNADLSGANLTGVKLHYANLSRANLTNGVNLSEASLNCANLIEADLTTAYLSNANLNNADLSRANLSDADLRWTLLSDAELTNTDFTRAVLLGTIFVNNDLRLAKGLDTVKHVGPSEISISTIYKFKDNIPVGFLRGAGVPENLIGHMGSLVGTAFDHYRCFISHSAKDRRFCERLDADLKTHGVTTFYFPEDAKFGEPVWGEIDRYIKLYDKVVVVCSKHSLQSIPVQSEIDRALHREAREKKNILLPIRIDRYLFDSWVHERKDDLVRKVVGDFTLWNKNNTKYDQALKRLLTALRSESTG